MDGRNTAGRAPKSSSISALPPDPQPVTARVPNPRLQIEGTHEASEAGDHRFSTMVVHSTRPHGGGGCTKFASPASATTAGTGTAAGAAAVAAAGSAGCGLRSSLADAAYFSHTSRVMKGGSITACPQRWGGVSHLLYIYCSLQRLRASLLLSRGRAGRWRGVRGNVWQCQCGRADQVEGAVKVGWEVLGSVEVEAHESGVLGEGRVQIEYTAVRIAGVDAVGMCV
jgi:hypothetical protein